RLWPVSRGAAVALFPARAGRDLRAGHAGRGASHSVFCQLGSLASPQSRVVAPAVVLGQGRRRLGRPGAGADRVGARCRRREGRGAAGQQFHSPRQQGGCRHRHLARRAVRPLPVRERAPHGGIRRAPFAPDGRAVARAPHPPGAARMKALPILVALLGVAAMAALVGYFGAGAVLRSLLAVGGGGFAAVCAIHLVLIAAMGLAWRAVLPGVAPATVVWARLVRDSGSEALPLSQVGGYVLGARALTLT